MAEKKTIEQINKEHPRRAGFYYLKIGGKDYKLPSVTTIIGKTLAKPALVPWAARTAAEIALNDPTLSVQECASGIYRARDKAANRGSMVHSLVESISKGAKIDIAGLPDEVRGYAQAFVDWFSMVKPKILLTEQVVYSLKYGYAGRLDFVADINGKIFLVDIKTGKTLYTEAFIQLSAYAEAIEEMGDSPDLFRPIDKIAGLLLKQDGSFAFQEGVRDIEPFLALKKVWEFLKKN